MSLNLQAVVSLNKSPFESGLGSIQAAVSNATGAMMVAFGGVAGEIIGMTRAFGPMGAAVTILKESVTVGASFEQQMANVASVTGLAGGELDRLSEAAREMAKTTRFSATQAADALYSLGSAGVQGADAIADALEPALLLAGATASNTALATETLTAAMASFQIPASQTTRIADQFAGAISASPANMQRLADAFRYAGPAAAGFEISLEKTVAEVSAFHIAGLRGEQAGTAFRQVLIQLSAAASKTGTEISDALQGWEASTEGITGAARRLSKAGIEGDEIIKALGARAGPALAALMKIGADAMDALAIRIQRNADVAKMYETQINTLSGRFDIFKSAVQELWLELYGRLAPVLTDLAVRATGLADAFGSLIRAVFAGDWAAVRKMMTEAFDAGRNAGGNFVEYLRGLNWLEIISPAMKIDWRGVFDRARIGYLDAFNRIYGSLTQFAAQVTRFLGAIDWMQLGRDALDAAKQAGMWILETIEEAVSGEAMKSTFASLGEMIGNALHMAYDLLRGMFDSYLASVKDSENRLGEALWNVFSNIFMAVRDFIVGILEGLFGAGIVDKVVTGAYIMLLRLQETFQKSAAWIVDMWRNFMFELVDLAGGMVSGVARFFRLKGIADKIKKGADEIADGFIGGTNPMRDAAEKTEEQIAGLHKYLDELKTPAENLVSPFQKAAEETEKAGKAAADAAPKIATVPKVVKPVAEGLKKITDAASDTKDEFAGMSDEVSDFKGKKLTVFDYSEFVQSLKYMSVALKGVDVPDIALPEISKFKLPKITTTSVSRFAEALRNLAVRIAGMDLSALQALKLPEFKMPDLTPAKVKTFLKSLGDLKDGLMELDFGALGKMDIQIKGAKKAESTLDEILKLLESAKGIVWA